MSIVHTRFSSFSANGLYSACGKATPKPKSAKESIAIILEKSALMPKYCCPSVKIKIYLEANFIISTIK